MSSEEWKPGTNEGTYIYGLGLSWTEAYTNLVKKVKNHTSIKDVGLVKIKGEEDITYCRIGLYLYKIEEKDRVLINDFIFRRDVRWVRVYI